MGQTFTDDCFASGHVAQTDMQNVETNFATLKSNFSGTASPANLVSGMQWFDTDVDLLYLRNAANDDWLSLGFPPGTIMMFGQKLSPLGWTKKTNWTDGAMLVVNSDADDTVLASGGGGKAESGHTHPAGTLTNGIHTHDFYTAGGSSQLDGVEGVYVASAGGMLKSSTQLGSGPIYSVYGKTKTSGAATVTGTSAVTGTLPYYQETIFCTKD